MPRVHIDVMLKDEILDPQGQAVERALPRLGFEGVRGVRVGKHVVIDLDEEGEELDARIAEMPSRLLANPVIEQATWRVEAG